MKDEFSQARWCTPVSLTAETQKQEYWCRLTVCLGHVTNARPARAVAGLTRKDKERGKGRKARVGLGSSIYT